MDFWSSLAPLELINLPAHTSRLLYTRKTIGTFDTSKDISPNILQRQTFRSIPLCSLKKGQHVAQRDNADRSVFFVKRQWNISCTNITDATIVLRRNRSMIVITMKCRGLLFYPVFYDNIYRIRNRPTSIRNDGRVRSLRVDERELARLTTRHFAQRRYNYICKFYAFFKLLTGRGYTGPTTLSVQSVARGLPSGS